MAYELEWEPNGVVFRFAGEVTDADLLDSNAEIYTDPRFDGMRYQIVDFSDITGVTVGNKTIARAAVLDQEASRRNPKVRVAIVAGEAFLYGMAGMYARSHEAMGGTWEVEIFDSEEKARLWLEA